MGREGDETGARGGRRCRPNPTRGDARQRGKLIAELADRGGDDCAGWSVAALG